MAGFLYESGPTGFDLKQRGTFGRVSFGLVMLHVEGAVGVEAGTAGGAQVWVVLP